MTHILVLWRITISPTCISLQQRLGKWLEVWTRGFIKDDVIKGRLLTTNIDLKQLDE